MKKTSALITAIALAFAGAAFAQDGGTGGPGNNSTVGQANPQASKNFRDLADKTKRGAKRMGAKARHAMQGDKHGHHQAHHAKHAQGTAAMGAPSSDTAAARQRRIDEAYANWQAQQARK